MYIKSFKTLVTLTLFLFSMGAFADRLVLGQPAYGGNGCPRGSIRAVLSPDQSTISILFDKYVARAGRSTGRDFDYRACNIAIPVAVPGGYSISIFKLDYRGFARIPSSGAGQFNVEYFFAGSQGPRVRRNFPGGFSDNFLITDFIETEAVVWSSCEGADTNLRVSTNVNVESSLSEEGLVSMDSLEVQGSLNYHLKIRKCRI